MNDFLKELFETYYKEQRKQDKIKLLEKEISFYKAILEEGYRVDFEKMHATLRKREYELKRLKENEDE